MTDAVLAVPTGTATDHLGRSLLDGRRLVDVLEDDSWSRLSAAVERAAGPRTIAEPGELALFTRDGRTLESIVSSGSDGVTIELHDVSRHVDEADHFARLAVQLHRRNRDLETLHDAATRLGETLDAQAIVTATASVVSDYLRPRMVLVNAAGYEGRAGTGGTSSTTPLAAATLTTARGDLGTVAWWRDSPLTDDERRVLDVIRHRAAVSIDHALLLAPPPGQADKDAHGLLPAPTARRRLAGFARPFAVALISHDGDVRAVAERVRGGRAGDVKAQWGPRRVLVALAGATEPQLRRWLAQSQVMAAPGRPAGWPVGIAVVEHDVDAAIAAADRALASSQVS